ncbi:hypothetical protein AHF37_01169 [Paragonimus kellicotti]|nr:hypothetical protein AHF37_01169 [Paragonimus kellicotti]
MEIPLRLLSTDGNYFELTVPVHTTIKEITDLIYKDWPTCLGPRYECNNLKLIFRGRFLLEDLSFADLDLTPGTTTVMHLIQQKNFLQPGKNGRNRRTKNRSSCLVCPCL